MSFTHDVLYALRDFRRHPGIPIVIVLDGEYQERGHWGPRPSELQRFVTENLSKVPKAELYPQTRRWYARDHGETTIREILAAAGAKVIQ